MSCIHTIDKRKVPKFNRIYQVAYETYALVYIHICLNVYVLRHSLQIACSDSYSMSIPNATVGHFLHNAPITINSITNDPSLQFQESVNLPSLLERFVYRFVTRVDSNQHHILPYLAGVL